MYVNQLMLQNPDRYKNEDNKDIIEAAVKIHETFSNNNWWHSKRPGDGISIFTANHSATVMRNGVYIYRLEEPPKYNFTEIDGDLFIEHKGWWLPGKLFLDIEDYKGNLVGEFHYVPMPDFISELDWLRDCSFRYTEGKLEFWYLESDYPIKKVISRALQEVKIKKFFKEKHNVQINAIRAKVLPSVLTDAFCYRL